MEDELAVMNEVIFIAETIDGEAVVLLDDDFFTNRSTEEIHELSNILYILARNKIMEDWERAPENRIVSISQDPTHKELVSAMRILLSEENDFDILVYFGGHCDPKTPIKKALEHCASILYILENNND